MKMVKKWSENITSENTTIQEVVNECQFPVDDMITACLFPYCENELACENDHLLDDIVEDSKEEVIKVETLPESKVISNVEQYFQCQEKLNGLEEEKARLTQEKKKIFRKVKTDIETVFIALDCNELGTKVELTQSGIKIIYPVKVFNDYQSTLIDTDLFTQLNNVMGMKGKLNMTGETKKAGNYIRILELIYEL